jgi:HAD superfamily hydrolase (TIGR01509 family)
MHRKTARRSLRGNLTRCERQALGTDVTTKHIIFDCDGVLVDSEPLSMRADVMLLRTVGIELSEEEAHKRFVGKTFQAMLDEMTEEYGIAFPKDFSNRKDAMLEDMFRHELRMVDGVADMLRDLSSRGLTFSVASNSPKPRVELALNLTGIRDFFSHVTTKDEVPNGKPAPDVYLRAAEKAGMHTSSCLVVEDSVTGTTAGVAAGIRTIGFIGVAPHPEELSAQLKTAGTSAVIEHMRELAAHTR